MLVYTAHTVANCLRIRQQIASAYGIKLLAHTAHVVAKSCKIVFFASVCCVCSSTLLAHTALTVANCQSMLRIRQQFASVCCAYGSNLLAYNAHTVTNRQIFCALLAMLRMRQPIASVSCVCSSNLLALTAHAVAKTKWPVSNPSVKYVKILFHP